MAKGADRKLFLGGRLKRLRRERALSQTAMAADLGVSPGQRYQLSESYCMRVIDGRLADLKEPQ